MNMHLSRRQLIWYVDIEHEQALRDPQRSAEHQRVIDFRAGVLSRASTATCESIRYTDLNRALAEERGVCALAVSGNVTDWDHYDMATFRPLLDLIQDGRLPVIAFCGGHQLLALWYGADCGPLRKLDPGEADPNDSFGPGYFKEVGFKPVRVVKDDPLFATLGEAPVFFESHYWEVVEPPAGFELLASTAECRVQAMKHSQYPIYSTQFHPEVNNEANPDGLTLLQNFFRIAGVREG
jgi:GMP synthase-like glutamine amidotransferase